MKLYGITAERCSINIGSDLHCIEVVFLHLAKPLWLELALWGRKAHPIDVFSEFFVLNFAWYVMIFYKWIWYKKNRCVRNCFVRNCLCLEVWYKKLYVWYHLNSAISTLEIRSIHCILNAGRVHCVYYRFRFLGYKECIMF